jgi:DNA-binding transcriptional regulator YiaG
MTDTRSKIDAAVERFSSDIQDIMRTWIEDLIVNGLDSAAERRAPAKKLGRLQGSGKRRGPSLGSKNKKVAKKTKKKPGTKKAPVKRGPRGPKRLEKAAAPPEVTPADIPAYVKMTRKKMGLSQEALAKKAGVKRGLIAHIEQGKLAPNAKVLEALGG